MKVKGTQKRGFVVMDPERVKAIASQGGMKARDMGVAHRWNEEEARKAGKIGGLAKKKPVAEIDPAAVVPEEIT